MDAARLPAAAATEESDPKGATVDEVIALYCRHELPTRPRSMQDRIKLALKPLHERFGQELANEFRRLDLVTLRTGLLESGRLSRGMVNQEVSLIRGVFAWAASIGRVDERVPFRLSMVKSLRRGQGGRERRVVQPIDWPTVEATLAHASEPIEGAILFQWFTGARPGEALEMTANDIDRSGKVWVYTPRHHKTEHHWRERRIFIGEEAQRVLRPFLVRRPADKPLFSPTEAIAEQKAAAAGRRRTRLQPSQARRARRLADRPRREVAEGYDVGAYRRAIARAIDAANMALKREDLAVALGALASNEQAHVRIADAVGRLPVHVKRPSRDRLIRRATDALRADEAAEARLAATIHEHLDAPARFEHWNPHRLRHAFAHRAVREVGDLEAVRCALGHASDAMTRHYAKPDDAKARMLAERMG